MERARFMSARAEQTRHLARAAVDVLLIRFTRRRAGVARRGRAPRRPADRRLLTSTHFERSTGVSRLNDRVRGPVGASKGASVSGVPLGVVKGWLRRLGGSGRALAAAGGRGVSRRRLARYGSTTPNPKCLEKNVSVSSVIEIALSVSIAGCSRGARFKTVCLHAKVVICLRMNFDTELGIVVSGFNLITEILLFEIEGHGHWEFHSGPVRVGVRSRSLVVDTAISAANWRPTLALTRLKTIRFKNYALNTLS
ncbi:hypothetical protein EVAR_7491_1 [Eumeta japonica]|uniref:Uncharacterized protein n=1 Tax=Eumeta variegata TaxID=151549 RepID=A0A4C1Y5G8_EUMVA|nr:hypothetical protein EVAR_7491_1 [Eumeta japonica]